MGTRMPDIDSVTWRLLAVMGREDIGRNLSTLAGFVYLFDRPLEAPDVGQSTALWPA